MLHRLSQGSSCSPSVNVHCHVMGTLTQVGLITYQVLLSILKDS